LEETALAIVVLLLWIATAAAGINLLRAGGAARAAAAPAAPAEAPVEAPVRIGAAPLTAAGIPPAIPHAKVATPAGDHTLLEFSHPALGICGIACWLMFTFIHYRPIAWIAVGFLAVTLLLGLGWETLRRRTGRQAPTDWAFPPRLVLLHGGVATCSLLLAVLAALTAAGHG
jgi:hypothetical protein